MLREITRAEVIKLITTLDTRAKEFSDDDFNYVIDMGYAELATETQAFHDEDILSLVEYYSTGEMKFTVDVQSDVAYIYELYLTMENQKDLTKFPHGIFKITDENCVYKDGRQTGRVHVDLDNVNVDRYSEILSNSNADNLVIKYAFTPTHTTESIYVDQPTYLAMRDAFGCALYNRLNSPEREAQKRASMKRTAKAITPTHPNDFRIPEDSNIADEGRVYIQNVFRSLGV